MKKINIAIDGYASTGKSTLAKDIAKSLNYIYIDTGAMYRAVTLFALRRKLIGKNFFKKQELLQALHQIDISFRHNPLTGKSETMLNGENVEEQIRQMEVSEYVSRIAEIPEVRKKLVEIQRKIARNKGVVMDGRDIGTVVMPDAELKIFMTASPEVRARRRWEELRTKGTEINYDEVLQNLMERDRIDSTRSVSPLTRTRDAVLLDNSELTREEQLRQVLDWVERRISEP